MKTPVKALAAQIAKGDLKEFEYELPDLSESQVDIRVAYCGVCHSDLSMLNNDWLISQYPFVPGHEIVGTVERIGRSVKHLKVGQKVGLGWFSESCMTCSECMSGDHNLCTHNETTMIGRYGGFAELVRCHASWAVPLPDSLDLSKAGPLFCGGITVFNPMHEFNVKPTDKVAVLGIGGLGHLAVQFLNKWGCEVTALSSSEDKLAEAKELGAHHAFNSKDSANLKKLSGKFDFILNTINVDYNWDLLMDTLAPKGRLHTVGAVPKPVSLTAFPMIQGQKTFSASPLGSPATIAKMLDFAARHKIQPITELYKMSAANEALEHLKAGKARYRVVLEADFN